MLVAELSIGLSLANLSTGQFVVAEISKGCIVCDLTLYRVICL